MRIADMFEKPIDRDIKGVIKVGQDDGENVLQELDEYVVTREMAKHFRDFFAGYKQGIHGHTDKMGVWISGFFGSGKSHFLKILSYLLNNKEVNGKKAIEFFTDGNKLQDQMVIADIKLAGSTSTDVILFNIDSKSEADAKANKDAIIDVFVKVFNEMQGFCGSLPFLAELERKLTEDGQYAGFKTKFKEIQGRDWEESREEFYFIQDEIVASLVALGIMSEEAARTWCEKAADTYSISIEKFAGMVRKYCESKGKDHHVVFLVDEIGQYIAGDTRLMLNLQTVTEDLGTACGGKAWVIVTSQQDIDSVVSVKGNDFSKIQGRFDTRLSLSSANVDEVIRKRILAKKPSAMDTLKLLYDQKEAILKNLITFTDEVEKKLYKTREDFAAVYPFIPYQFNLLGQVLTAIRTHGASGKHLAEGERSMIALFKESAMRYMDESEGIIVPFNIFYNALDKFIDHTHRIVITQAADNSKLQHFDVELLKVLFMIKYVKEIKGNIENLTTLMVSHIDQDRIALRKQVEEALARLIKQTLVQKNGDIYMFLTNEEQDINKAIQNETVELSEIINEASGIFFQDLIKEQKYRYNARYNFAFNQIVDDRFFKNNQSADIGVRIITPYSDREYRPDMLRMLSLQENNVIVHLPNDATFLDEITEALKIGKFITKQGVSLAKSFEAIKRAKQDELIEKKQRIRIFLEEAVKNADMYVSGDKANIGAKDPAGRINEALGKLVNTIYNKLSYMETAPALSDIDAVLRTNSQTLFENFETKIANKLALDDLLAAIELAAARHTKTSLKTLLDRFTTVPYGFVELDVQWLVAMLFKQGKVTFTVNSKNISPVDTDINDLMKYITKREYAEKLLIQKRERATEKQIKSVKTVMKDLFAMTAVTDEDDMLMKNFKGRTANKLNEIEKLLVEYRIESRFPGKTLLTQAKGLLGELVDITNPIEFFKFVDSRRDDLLDLAEDISPVFTFFEGEQKTILAKAFKYMDIFRNSKTYVVDEQIIANIHAIQDIATKGKPYNEIHKLPALIEQFLELHTALLEKEAKPIRAVIELDLQQVLDVLKQKSFADQFESQFANRFAELKTKLESSNEVAAVKNIRHESDALKVRCLNEIAGHDKKLADIYKASMKQKDTSGKEEIATYVTKKTKNISLKQVALQTTVTIEKEADIDQFLQSIKTRLLKELSEDKDTVIQLLM
ncbi:BREX system P-loop protein BrxC [Sporomusa sphaeroides DSM 2875]|uniref:BREX system P-loop protein BrxC n=1 Tax=Sporomusa sphaeroides TaxID=47679 RepID=UPI0020302D32|nr:BREX system P-loop protein BrxC [Sporomusa sphaeroides]MCM0758599.1 BREX system P-loop protein BrxC [Sporomusa sphaeroides DSM 2875]